MPLLLRLLLCLTLLANTAGGAWAMPAGGEHALAAAPQSMAKAGCHEAGDHGAMSMPGHAPDAAQSTDRHAPPADPGCCKHAGCDCLQHCGTPLGLPAAIASDGPRSQDPAWHPAYRRGLPHPYQPVRPPIA